MSTVYLSHFGLQRPPFALTPNTEFYCDFSEYQAAFNTLLFSLRSGEGFIKIIGEVGTGKTLLCRRLLNTLDNEYALAYIPNPDFDAKALRKAIGREFGLSFSAEDDAATVIEKINHRLCEFHQQGKRPVLIVDEAQVMPNDALEALRLLSNLELQDEKLLQIVFFAQPELDARLETSALRQLKQRIVFSYYLQPLSRDELDEYLYQRLIKAGLRYRHLFSKEACDLLYQTSQGIPRLINILCHKALISAFGRGCKSVELDDMRLAVNDGHFKSAGEPQENDRVQTWLLAAIIVLSLVAIGLIVLAVADYFI